MLGQHAGNSLPSHSSVRSFSASRSAFAKPQRPKTDRRITLIRYHLSHPLTPRPLRFSRLRALRHWTIHRAWQLYQHKLRRDETKQLENQYKAMQAACEELRVGLGDGGRLFRQAMVKKGVYGGGGEEFKKEGRGGGVPVEYGKAQTEGPGRDGWNHAWRR
ncbi:hypothetical protein MMC25_003888 [Agyrium rufum]|nr:hypothetical protein [Agyrium rufum]